MHNIDSYSEDMSSDDNYEQRTDKTKRQQREHVATVSGRRILAKSRNSNNTSVQANVNSAHATANSSNNKKVTKT